MKPFLLILFATFTMSCASNDASINPIEQEVVQTDLIAKDISVKEFKSLINEKAIVLDVRRKIEYDAGHIKDAVNIDWFSESFMDEVSKLDKSKTLLIHCASGGRSSSAMRKLKSSGFKVMYNMTGGFNAWKRANYEYEK